MWSALPSSVRRGRRVRGTTAAGAGPSCRARVHAFPDLRLPERVVDDAVDVGVVLGEVAGGVLEVPEEVRADVVATEAPYVAFGICRRACACAPRPISSTSSTCHDVWCRKATGACWTSTLWWSVEQRMKAARPATVSLTLKPMPSVKKRWVDVVVGRAEHDVPELARTHGSFAQDAGCARAGPVDAARSVVRRKRVRVGLDARCDLHPHGHLRAGVDGRDRRWPCARRRDPAGSATRRRGQGRPGRRLRRRGRAADVGASGSRPAARRRPGW